MSGPNHQFDITEDDVAALAPLVIYTGGICYGINAQKILRGLGRVVPSPTTITWLRAVMRHPEYFYGQWGGEVVEGEKKDTSSGQQEVHWVSVYPAYLEQYVIVGGSVSTPITKGGKALGLQFPEMFEYENKWKDMDYRETWKLHGEMGVLLGKMVIYRGSGSYYYDGDIIAIMAKYLMVVGMKARSQEIELVTASLLRLRGLLSERHYNYAIAEVISILEPKVVNYYLRNGDGVLCRDFFATIGRKTVADALDKYGDRARLLLCPTGMLQHLLGWPVRCDRGRLQEEVLKVLENPETFAVRTIERNLEDAQTIVDKLGSWAKVGEIESGYLRCPPGDLVWELDSDNEVTATLRGGEKEDLERGSERWLVQKRALANGLPVDPLPALHLVNLLCDVEFHQDRLGKG